ncbi:MAG: nitroreductase family protein [Actinomycetota bacterium]
MMTARLGLSADEVLTTTRSVRKRLDLERPVPRDVLTECIEIAHQAPTGSNLQGWRWLFVDDPVKKKALADMYRANFYPYVNDPNRPQRDDQGQRIVDSATYLADILDRVPVMLNPLNAGRLDTGTPTFGQASAWGSLLPAVWSFMLALRERGLGSAWTTLHLPNEREAADLLGIPFDQYTQAGLFPVAYTIGTDFKIAKRVPAEKFIRWNSWT